MAFEIMPKRGVTKNYGVRATGGANGQYKSDNQEKTLSFKLDLQTLTDFAAGNYALNSYIGVGASILTAKVVVHTAFDATAAVTFQAGTTADPDAQGTFPIAALELDAVGVTDITPTGNLAVGDLVDAVGNFSVLSAVPGAVAGEAELIVTYVQTVV